MNKNTEALARGMAYRIEISGAQTAARCNPEFTRTKTEASQRRKMLREGGLIGTVFQITADGGLTR